jgi:Flp pilus assembly CpaE family ATPase
VISSARVLLVFQLNVKDLRIARSMLDALDERGVSRSNITGIANRFAKRPAISIDDAAKVLDGIEVKVVRNDYASALEGLNYGKTLSQVAPRSPLRKDVQDLAASIAQAAAARLG